MSVRAFYGQAWDHLEMASVVAGQFKALRADGLLVPQRSDEQDAVDVAHRAVERESESPPIDFCARLHYNSN